MSNVIDAVFKLTDEFSQPFSNCVSALTDAGKAGKTARKQVDQVGKSISKVGTTLTASVTLPVVAAGTACYQTFAEVDQSLALVQKTMGETDEDFAVLEQAVKDAASASVLDMADAADAALNFARQGYSAAEAADMIGPAMDAAVGTATDMSTVTSGLGAAMSVFGASSDQATDYLNMMTQGANQANTNLEQMFEGVSVVGPMFKGVGYDIKDVITAVDAFGDAGISASEGAHAVSTGLLRLATASSTGIDSVDKAVASLFNEEGELKSFPEVLTTLQDAFKDLSTEEALGAMDTLFGKNQTPKWQALLNTDAAAIQDYYDGINEALEGGTLVSDMAASQMNSEGAAMESLSSSLNVLKYNFGEIISGYITPFINKLIELTDWLANLDPATQDTIVRFAGIAAVVGPVLVVFGKLVSFTSVLFGAFSKIQVAGGLVKGALAAISAPAGVVVAVIAAIAAVVAIIIYRFNDFKAAVEACVSKNSEQFAALGAAFSTVAGAITGVALPAFNFLVDLVGNVLVGAFNGLINSDFFTLFLTGVTNIVTGVTDVISGLLSFVVDVFTGDWNGAWLSIQEVFSGVASVISGLLDGILGLLGSIGSAVGGVVEGIGTTLVNAVTGGSGMAVGANASGTSNWRGGLTRVNEQGGEIMNLPSGTQIIPHDLSRNMLNNSGSTVTITGNTFTVREQADIDRITDALVRKMYRAQANMGTA